MLQFFKMAFRDLGRNRRRTFFSALAVGASLALLMLMSAVINGEMGGAVEQAIHLQSGHIQVRAATYDENKNSLKWEDLVENPDKIASQIAALPPVAAATPRLYASGFLATGNESAGVRLYGIDPASAANDPYRNGLLNGSFLTADDNSGLLIGEPMAARLHLNVGDSVGLSVNTANGNVDEQNFTVRGIFSTNTYGFDNSTVLMPLAKAQALTQTQNHSSTIFILLKDTAATATVIDALKSSGSLKVLTFEDMNPLVIQWEQMAKSYIGLFFMIILAIGASVIINTLIMSVYERTREIGILAAIGMRGRGIMSLFLAESSLLAVGGVIFGLILGMAGIYLFNINGFNVGKMGISGILVSNTVYAKPVLADNINLAIITFIVTLLAGLYPAIMASRLEPVEALRAEK
jgi:ABC-type lipoprotein release transport system permease subunit